MSIEFKRPDIEKLKERIQKELKETPFVDKIIKKNEIEIEPIYTKANKPIQIPHSLNYRICFQYFGLDKSKVKEVNKSILQDLENGVNGLLLGFKNENWSLNEMETLLQNIRLDFVHTEFVELSDETRKNILDYLKSTYPDLDWSHVFLPEHFHYLADENYIEHAANFIAQSDGDKALIYIELSGDYYWDIAKIRAFKILAFNHAKLKGYSPHYVLVGETTLKNKSKKNLENNILNLTTETMAGMIGGCEGLWIRPFDHKIDNRFSQRISRNIFHLMQEESYIQLVSDVSSGSYFIENYTEAIAKKIYSKLL